MIMKSNILNKGLKIILAVVVLVTANLLYDDWPFLFLPDRPLTSKEAEKVCIGMLHNYDRAKLQRILVKRGKELPGNTPTWEFYYVTPEDPEYVHSLVWYEHGRSRDHFIESLDGFEATHGPIINHMPNHRKKKTE